MDMLSQNEARVLGVLMEKEVTTPDQYPLSLNSLTSGCNQKSSREPVIQLTEAEVLDSVSSLIEKHIVLEDSGFGSRVIKYKHRFCNTEFGKLTLTGQEFAIICLLLLRGPQTPGELRSRSGRMCQFKDVAETESVLNHLMSREDGPFVRKLPREPGKRESRFQQLIAEETLSVDAQPSETTEDNQQGNLEQRVKTLELQVATLISTIEDLKNDR